MGILERQTFVAGIKSFWYDGMLKNIKLTYEKLSTNNDHFTQEEQQTKFACNLFRIEDWTGLLSKD
jgi:endo-beta-N-acetylglucosaminidase D